MAAECVVIIVADHCRLLLMAALTECCGVIGMRRLGYQAMVGGFLAFFPVYSPVTSGAGEAVIAVQFNRVTTGTSGNSIRRLFFRALFLTAAPSQRENEEKYG